MIAPCLPAKYRITRRPFPSPQPSYWPCWVWSESYWVGDELRFTTSCLSAVTTFRQVTGTSCGDDTRSDTVDRAESWPSWSALVPRSDRTCRHDQVRWSMSSTCGWRQRCLQSRSHLPAEGHRVQLCNSRLESAESTSISRSASPCDCVRSPTPGSRAPVQF